MLLYFPGTALGSLALSLYTTVYVSFSQGPHIGLWKAGLCNSPATWINCHLLRVNGGVKNGEGLIVSGHWYAEHCGITIRTLIGFDQNLMYLNTPPHTLICEGLSSPCHPKTASVTGHRDQQKQPGSHEVRPCMAPWEPIHPYQHQLCLICFLIKSCVQRYSGTNLK